MRYARKVEIRPDRTPEFSDEPVVELHITKSLGEGGSMSAVETMTAGELVDMHQQVTLWMASVEGRAFLHDAGIEYRAKISSAPERHPEWEACKR